MKSKFLNAKVFGITAALIIFFAVRFILGRNEDGNLVVFGVPAIIGGLIVFYTIRSINRKS